MTQNEKDPSLKANNATGRMEDGNSQMHQQEQKRRDPHISFGAQYVKDLSFENPKAPHSLAIGQNKPSIDLKVDATAHRVHGETYEVMLHIIARAIVNKTSVIFLCDLSYCGLFTLVNIAEKDRDVALLVHGANNLFPFARRIIADLTRDGGYPTLILDPIDFGKIYLQKKKKLAEAHIEAHTPSQASAEQSTTTTQENLPMAKKKAKKKPAKKKKSSGKKKKR